MQPIELLFIGNKINPNLKTSHLNNLDNSIIFFRLHYCQLLSIFEVENIYNPH